MLIVSIRHKALRRFVETGNPRGLPSMYADKIGSVIQVIDNAPDIEAFLTVPYFRTHALKGDRAGFYSASVSRNWRMTFRYDAESNTVEILDLEDYH